MLLNNVFRYISIAIMRGGGAGGGYDHKSQRFKMQNHKSQSF